MSGVGVAFGLGVALALAYERVEGGDVAVSNFLPEPILFESQAIVDNHMANTIKTPLASRIGIFIPLTNGRGLRFSGFATEFLYFHNREGKIWLT